MPKTKSSPIFVWRSNLEATGELESELKGGFPSLNSPQCIYCGFAMPGKWISKHDPEVDKRVKDQLLREEEQEKLIRRNYSDVRGRIERDAQMIGFNLGHAEERIERYAPTPWHPYRYVCERCGWWLNSIRFQAHDELTAIACLRRFLINDGRLAIDEIMSHLSKKYSDIYNLAPRRFEEVVSRVFLGMGYTIELTKSTRDGGADIICLAKGSGKIIIVECKRYAESRKVGIDLVHRLVGAKYDFGADAAYLVTTSSFTKPACSSAHNLNRQNLNVNLVDGHELLKLLKCYSNPTMTVKDVRAIFRRDQ